MTKTIIGLDMDGVILDHTQTIVDWAEHRGKVLAPIETTLPSLKEVFDAQELDQLFDFMYESPTNYMTSRLMEGALQGIKTLQHSGNPFYLLSRRNSADNAQKALEYFGLWPEFFEESNTFFVERSSKKIAVAQQFGITHYVDDQANALLSVMEPINNKILFDQYETLPESPNYTKVSTWHELTGNILSY